MYLAFYGLKRKPFQNSTNPGFFWLGEMHKRALAGFKHGIQENQGFLLLTGDVGTGKTILINALVNSLGDEIIVAKVPDPGLELIDFLNYVAHAFDMHKKFANKEAFLIDFEQFLQSAHAAGKKILLIIDECQRLSSELLEEVRQLSNIEKQETKLLNIFFIGQNHFNNILKQEQNRALLQRISLNYLLTPLDINETGDFIRHRLKIAGAERDIFSPAAIRGVFDFSAGFPRKINMICDHALLSGYAQRMKSINGKIIAECAKDLCLPASLAKPKAGLLDQGVAGSSRLETLETAPPEHRSTVSPISAWRIVGMTMVILLGVLTLAYINYPEESQDLYYRCKNKSSQLFAVFLRKEQSSRVKNNAEQYSKTDASQGLDGENSVMPVSSKTMADPLSIIPANSDIKEIEHHEESVPAESAVQSFDISVAETVTTTGSSPSDSDDTAVADSPEKELKEPAIQKNDTNISPEIETLVTEKIINDQDDATVEPAQPVESRKETKEEVKEEPENMDPGAVIEWMLNNRAK